MALNAVLRNAPVVCFGGVHEDALVGADVKLAGVSKLTDNHKAVFEALEAAGQLNKHVSGSLKATPPLALSLVLEQQANGEPDAMRLDYEGKTLGYIPEGLVAEIAPLVADGGRFNVHLMEAKPYTDWRSKTTRYSVEARLELLTKSGRAPNMALRDKTLAAFESARTHRYGLDQILTVIPERLDTVTVNGKTLTQRYDQERGEKSYYTGGYLVARGKPDAQSESEPVYTRQNIAEPMKAEIKRLLNTLI